MKDRGCDAMGLCSDGRPFHDFRGHRRCPDCGYAGLRGIPPDVEPVQCEGTRRHVDGSPYRCPLKLRTPGKTLCGRCEMAIVEYGVEQRWADQ